MQTITCKNDCCSYTNIVDSVCFACCVGVPRLVYMMRDSSMCGLCRGFGGDYPSRSVVLDQIEAGGTGVVSDAMFWASCGTCIDIRAWSVIRKDAKGDMSVLFHAFVDGLPTGPSWSSKLPKAPAYETVAMETRDHLLSALFVSVTTATVTGALDPGVAAAICTTKGMDIARCKRKVQEAYGRVSSIAGIAALMSERPMDALGSIDTRTLGLRTMCEFKLWEHVGMAFDGAEEGQSNHTVCITMKRRAIRNSETEPVVVPNLEPLVWLVDRTTFPTQILRQYGYKIDNRDNDNYQLSVSHQCYKLAEKQPVITNVSSGSQSVYPCPVPLFNALLFQSSWCSCGGCNCHRRLSSSAAHGMLGGSHQMRFEAYNELDRQISSLCGSSEAMRSAMVVDSMIGLFKRHSNNGDLNSIMSFLIEFNVGEANGGFSGRAQNLLEPIQSARRVLFERLQNDRILEMLQVGISSDIAIFTLNKAETPCISTCLKTEHILLALTTDERAGLFGALLDALQSCNVQRMTDTMERFKDAICVWLRYNPISIDNTIHFPVVYNALIDTFNCSDGARAVDIFYQASFSFDCMRDRIMTREAGGFRVWWHRQINDEFGNAQFTMDVPEVTDKPGTITIECNIPQRFYSTYLIRSGEREKYLLSRTPRTSETEIQIDRVTLKKTPVDITIFVRMNERYNEPDSTVNLSIVLRHNREFVKLVDITI